MRTAALRFIGPLFPLLVVSACTDVTTAPPPDATIVDATSHAVLTCDLTTGMTSDVRSYFPQPERRAAQETMRLLGTACGAGDPLLTAQYAFDLLAMIETLLEAGGGGDAVVGSRLANALLACTTEAGCAAAALPGLSLVGPMSHPAGVFALYVGSSAEPAVARAGIAFVDFADEQNSALFGVELSDGFSWTQVNGTDFVLIYGQPAFKGDLNLQETSIGDLVYQFNRWPSPGPFVDDDIVHIGVCFLHEIELPHDDQTGKSTLPRMQREGTLLSSYSPTFCPTPETIQTASVLAPLTAFARSLLRTSGLIALDDVKAPRVGGSALDFSHFAPVAANTEGHLEMLTGPPDVAAPGASLGPISIRARSGGGTPVERVLVTLYVLNNSGLPAGAVLLGDDVTGYTTEDDGTVVIDGTSINKTGGYTICARGELEGFTFEEACSPMFHIRN
jgi:hypothetical protein